jgi:hypothetical protein
MCTELEPAGSQLLDLLLCCTNALVIGNAPYSGPNPTIVFTFLSKGYLVIKKALNVLIRQKKLWFRFPIDPIFSADPIIFSTRCGLLIQRAKMASVVTLIIEPNSRFPLLRFRSVLHCGYSGITDKDSGLE